MDNGNVLEFVKRDPGCDLVKLVSTLSRIILDLLLLSHKALDMAEGLAYLHEMGIIHSDLKSVSDDAA